MTMKRFLPAVLGLLAAFSVHAAEPASAARWHLLRSKATEYPPGSGSFLDLREDIDEARKNGKRVILMFTQDGCPYCSRCGTQPSQREIEATMRKSSTSLRSTSGRPRGRRLDGKPYTEKSYSAALKIQFTPACCFSTRQQNRPAAQRYVPRTHAGRVDWVGGRHESKIASAISSPRAKRPRNATAK